MGGELIAGGALKATGTTVAGTGLWRSPNKYATNLSGFTGLPAGYRLTGEFFGITTNGRFWSATESSANQAGNRVLYYFYAKFNRWVSFKPTGYSVRCVRD
ncbi:MAG: hypothetical protein GC205_11600 [Bacteroidetes bacterium]|nr:hypothetical protein [Bacteroidota bacterium]